MDRALEAEPLPDGGVRSLRGCGRLLLRQPRSVAWLLPVLWAALIWWLSSQESLLGDREPDVLLAFLGNLAHPAAFGLLALFLLPLLPRRGDWVPLGSGAALAVLAAVTAYGFVDEVHQSRIPGREASLLDLLSDAVGAACVLVVARYVGRDDAHPGGLRRRVGWCLVACVVAAALSSWWSAVHDGGPWPFAGA